MNYRLNISFFFVKNNIDQGTKILKYIFVHNI